MAHHATSSCVVLSRQPLLDWLMRFVSLSVSSCDSPAGGRTSRLSLSCICVHYALPLYADVSFSHLRVYACHHASHSCALTSIYTYVSLPFCMRACHIAISHLFPSHTTLSPLLLRSWAVHAPWGVPFPQHRETSICYACGGVSFLPVACFVIPIFEGGVSLLI